MLGAVDDGDEDRARGACRSRTPSRARRRARYELRPEDLLRGRPRGARSRGMDLVGIYHSHPDCDAYFSETDLKNSCPWYSFVVLSIQERRASTTPTSWLPNAEQTAAEPEELSY